jgi:nucleoid-associated protein YgaU
MADPLTEPFEPYQPEPAYDWEYDEEPRTRKGGQMPNVLWGRVAILGAMILFAFLLGRMTKSSGVPASELEAANDEVAAVQEDLAAANDQIAALQTQVDDLQAAAAPTDTTEDPAATEDTEDPAATDTTTEETYVVKPDETLSIIAERFYGDASLADFLAEANGIEDPTAISAGQELIIPEEPE